MSGICQGKKSSQGRLSAAYFVFGETLVIVSCFWPCVTFLENFSAYQVMFMYNFLAATF